jgi:repressor LexA
MSEPKWTEKQGQYLAFIHNYTLIHGQPPAETDMQRFFGTRPPTIHQMVVRLTEKGLITRKPGEARTIRVLVPPEELPRLRERQKGRK